MLHYLWINLIHLKSDRLWSQVPNIVFYFFIFGFIKLFKQSFKGIISEGVMYTKSAFAQWTFLCLSNGLPNATFTVWVATPGNCWFFKSTQADWALLFFKNGIKWILFQRRINNFFIWLWIITGFILQLMDWLGLAVSHYGRI